MVVRVVNRMDADHIMEWLNDPKTPVGDTIAYYTGSSLTRDRAEFTDGGISPQGGRTGVWKDTTFGNACTALHDAAMGRRVCLTQRMLGHGWYEYSATMRRRYSRGDY